MGVLHHISSETRRVMLVEETMRVLRVGGVALFYAWAYEQSQGGVSGHMFEASDVLVPFHKKVDHNTAHRDDVQKCALDGAIVDDNVGACVFQRYCHVFREGELSELFQGLFWCEVEASYYDCGNWCVEVRKKTDRPPM